MVEILSINKIFIILLNIVGLWLGLWVLYSNKKSRVNQMFFLLTIFNLLWITFAFFALLPSQISHALLWRRLAFGASSLFFIPAYFFAIHFPREEKRCPILDKIVILAGVFLSIISIFTDLIVKNIQDAKWGTDIILGKGIVFLYGIIIPLTFIIIFHLLKKYFKASKEEKLKIQYFLIGASIFAFMNLIFNALLPIFRESYRYYQFGDYSVIFFLGFTAYAIVKRELFGIKVVLTQLLVGLIAILLLVNVIVSDTLFEYIWKGALFGVFLIFGYLLIKSVLKEIKYREEIAKAYEVEKKAHKELKRLDDVKTQFLMASQHHLRSPLNTMIG